MGVKMQARGFIYNSTLVHTLSPKHIPSRMVIHVDIDPNTIGNTPSTHARYDTILPEHQVSFHHARARIATAFPKYSHPRYVIV